MNRGGSFLRWFVDIHGDCIVRALRQSARSDPLAEHVVSHDFLGITAPLLKAKRILDENQEMSRIGSAYEQKSCGKPLSLHIRSNFQNFTEGTL